MKSPPFTFHGKRWFLYVKQTKSRTSCAASTEFNSDFFKDIPHTDRAENYISYLHKQVGYYPNVLYVHWQSERKGGVYATFGVKVPNKKCW